MGQWPVLIKEDSEKGVEGELYNIDNETLDRLDYLEGHPDFYKREVIKVTNEAGEEKKAWAYVFPKEGLNLETLKKVYSYDD